MDVAAGSTRERVVRFGLFEFRTDTHELWKQGIRIRLQTKPAQILTALLDHPGELVTREELCHQLWPDGVFVDFESGLNTATNRLRTAIGDSAEQPRFIETLPRLGYRFICPIVEVIRESDTAPTLPPVQKTCFTLGPVDAVPTSIRPVDARILPIRIYGAIGLLLATFAGLLVAGAVYSRSRSASGPSFQPLTYRPVRVSSARFLPGSKSAIYTDVSATDMPDTISLSLDHANIQPHEIARGTLASVSRSGELALLTRRNDQRALQLFDFPANAQRSSQVAPDVRYADWLPDGRAMAWVRTSATECSVEFPAGHQVYRYPGWITDLRVSPDGKRVAFVEHPFRDDDRGHVRIVDTSGRTWLLTSDWSSISGLAWSRFAHEIWFTASKSGLARALYAVSDSARLRRISNAPASLRLFDIADNGRVLMSVEDLRSSMIAKLAGEQSESDISQFDDSNVAAISANGDRLLFTEAGLAGGQNYQAFIFDAKSHNSYPLGRGRGMALSPNGRFAITIDPQNATALSLITIDSGMSRCIYGYGIHYQWARFVSDTSLLVGGSSPGAPLRLYRQALVGGAPSPLAGLHYVDWPVVSADGHKVAGLLGRKPVLLDLTQNSMQSLPVQNVLPFAWAANGRSLLVATLYSKTPELLSLDLQSGSLNTWKTLHLADSAAYAGLGGIVAAPDAGAYAYSIHQNLSRLYVVDGWS